MVSKCATAKPAYGDVSWVSNERKTTSETDWSMAAMRLCATRLRLQLSRRERACAMYTPIPMPRPTETGDKKEGIHLQDAASFELHNAVANAFPFQVSANAVHQEF
jgi:hypothetical protein